MKIFSLFGLLWVGVVPLTGQAQATTAPVNGQISFEFNNTQRNTGGPYATANTLKPGLLALPADVATLRTELRASANGLTGNISLQQQDGDANASASSARVNELFASHDAGAWQFSAGKKIVAWDVGYGFRPNDMVQQEERRTLVSRTPEGRPMLVAEHFNANTAWSAVWVNPTASMDALGAQEPALAARVYQRNGAADWYGFARVGAHTGASLGAALAWVASESLELHSSVRHSNQVDSTAVDPKTSGLVVSNPWQPSTVHNVSQWLVGGTWTHQSQVSLLAEAWWDGSAPSDAQWDSWVQRNQQLGVMAALGAPAAAVAGNLAWQAEGLGLSQNLRRSNVYLRLSWQNGAWQPALDVLYTPADQGRVVTASLNWQGDRVQVQGGLRAYGGPVDAVMVQLPSRQLAYVAMNWAF
jgi:hypothetical protein